MPKNYSALPLAPTGRKASKNSLSTTRLIRKPFQVKRRIPQGRIENGALIKRVKVDNFHRGFQAWGISQEVLENALEQGAEFLELQVDDGRLLRVRILTALNHGIRHQFDDYEPQIFLTSDLLKRLDNPQLALFGGDDSHE